MASFLKTFLKTMLGECYLYLSNKSELNLERKRCRNSSKQQAIQKSALIQRHNDLHFFNVSKKQN